MNQVVIVHFFGKFCLETDIGYLDEEKIHSKKLITLLAFLLLNYNRMIPAEELGELMWGNGGSSNPIGALKNHHIQAAKYTETAWNCGVHSLTGRQVRLE